MIYAWIIYLLGFAHAFWQTVKLHQEGRGALRWISVAYLITSPLCFGILTNYK